MTLNELSTARAELVAKLAALDASIAAHQAGHRAERVAEVRALMTDHGLTMIDIGRPNLASVKPRKPIGAVAPKYRDPKTGSTWTGRGRQPLWYITATASGASPESLKIVPHGVADDKIAA